ncbi:uncharacterized protein PRCAT00000290001 [Priceomyces carsonii]|uniref:uncharacterized protein n=1 Tax=Priceomyces carsonii TaxID=28549 RepID=UPI002EDB150C|nr:unnamed protein product [Priceomyces carsonii]
MDLADWTNFPATGPKNDEEGYFPELHEEIQGTAGKTASLTGERGNSSSNYHGDSMFLHHLDHDLYENGGDNSTSTNNSNNQTSSTHQSSRSKIFPNDSHYEFEIDNINFMLPEDLNFEENGNTQSSAFPPSNMPQPTPNMNPANKYVNSILKDNSKAFASPVLPSQNEKSYNNQHYYHKHNNISRSDSFQNRNHVRPDAVFSPLVSPAVTPLDSQVNMNKTQYNPPLQTSFEPLTSPALGADQDKKRRSSPSVYGTSDDAVSYKRRTPHGTPIMQPNDSTRSKKSPAMKTRNSRRSSSSLSVIEKISEPSIDPSKYEETSAMLPPQAIKVDIDPSVGERPALMGFTMGRLAEQFDENFNENNSEARSRSSRRSYSNKILPKSSSSSEASPILTEQRSNSSAKPKYEKPATKKASHKIAEQGRRIRMNTAVSELATLVPQSYHDQVAIPSKATTVELASKYIRDLVKEIDTLKKNL